jgi:hypothetical protein
MQNVCGNAKNIHYDLPHFKWRCSCVELTRVAKNPSAAFPYLQQVIKAQVDRFPADGTKGRPERVIEDIIKNVSTGFDKVCREFWSRESIYGFGDTRVKKLYEKVMDQH